MQVRYNSFHYYNNNGNNDESELSVMFLLSSENICKCKTWPSEDVRI